MRLFDIVLILDGKGARRHTGGELIMNVYFGEGFRKGSALDIVIRVNKL